MEKIPTAYNWLKKEEKNESGVYDEMTILHAMMTFAKLHVEAALKAAEYCTEEYDFSVEIKSSYPLENIK